MKKSLKMLAGSLILLTALTGCTSKGEKKKAANKDYDYKIATVRWSDWGTDFLKGFVSDSEKENGIKPKWDIYLNADWSEKKAVMMASGDLPDVFMGGNCLTESEVAQNQELFLQLDDYIDKYMPNFKAAMEKEPQFKAMAYAPDGHIYGLPAKLPMRPTIGNQLFINQVWLDNLNLEMPQTFDELNEVLKAFKENDANGNGDPDDEIPYGGGGASAIYGYIMPLNNREGASYDTTLDDSGNPQYNRITENYKNGIKAMRKGWEAGFFDPEMFTQDGTMEEAKRQDSAGSRVGVNMGWTADAVFGANAKEYVALPALEGPDGKRHVLADPDHYNYKKNEVLINKDAKQPEKLLKWLDSFYTDDASIQNFYGSFGIATEKEKDGTYKVLPPKEGESADIFAWTHSLRDFGPKFVEEGFNDKVAIDDTQGDGLKLKLDAELKEFAVPAFPNVNYTPEEIDRLSTIYADIDTYVQGKAAEWITKGGIDKDWDNYIKELKKMNLDEFLEIQNNAFARYQKALTK